MSQNTFKVISFLIGAGSEHVVCNVGESTYVYNILPGEAQMEAFRHELGHRTMEDYMPALVARAMILRHALDNAHNAGKVSIAEYNVAENLLEGACAELGI